MNKFYLGMDIGTSSVGMACTDEEYRLLRAKGKDLWAVRLFDEAETAVKRRNFRTARRRLQRRKYRIELLQSLFIPYMTDRTFFLRLNNSALYREDKDASIESKYVLFADKNYTDKDFYRRYPTVFHLRKALTEGKEKADIRLYYIAVHHIVKYRGHFLFAGKSMSEITDISRLFRTLNDALGEVFSDDAPYLDEEKAVRFKEIVLTEKGRGREKRAVELFGIGGEREKELIKFLVGGKASPRKLFDGKYGEEKSFSAAEISDEEFEGKRSVYGDDFVLLETIRAVCNYISFEKILNGKENISLSMTEIYEKHSSDLKLLKKLIKENYGQEGYNRFFKGRNEKANYVNYIGYTKIGGKKKNVKKCNYEEFLSYLKKFISDKKGDCEVDKVLEECESKTFLPKILHADNGLFPYQVNLSELEKILANMRRDYPETEEAAQKIRDLFLFRVPYYVGPLNEYGKNSWIVKLKREKITPWNFDEVVDRAASNEAFMRRMTGKCSYLHGKDVLPKCSIYYQKFDVLNQINKLRIDEQPIRLDIKQRLYNELFLRDDKVTIGKIREFLVEIGQCSQAERRALSISGIDGEIKANMSSYVRLKKILGDFTDEHIDICEDIILWHTLNTDKNLVEDLILKKYGSFPAIKENIGKIKGMSCFKDFGRLSKEFLRTLTGGFDPATGEAYTVLGELYNTNMNLNEILFDRKYDFQAAIAEENGGGKEEVSDEDIEGLYVSPAVKRGVRQALKMTDEYVAAVGRKPDKIFIEVTRASADKKERTVSRKNQLLAQYKELSKDAADIKELTEELNGKSDLELRSERLYLYFRQLGKCMYSEEKISLDKLFGDTYDVDHILPRSYTKDDSLSNKVLVLRSFNAQKSDRYPLPQGFVAPERRNFWKFLRDKGLLPEKTYKLLMRTEPLGEEDFKDFINRQKVITDQTVKAVAELLRKKYERYGTKIVYSKAKYVSDFKNEYGLVKCRETNDLHHARDAYINIAVGNVYDVEFSGDFFYRNNSGEQREKNFKNLFRYSVAGAWDKETSLAIVKRTYYRTSMSVTRFSYVKKGEFYDQNAKPKDDEGVSVPRKGAGVLSQTEKYGGYKSPNTAYFCLVSSVNKKGKSIRTLEAVPVFVTYLIRSGKLTLAEYFESKLNCPQILVPMLKIKSLVKVNGSPAYLAGVTGNRLVLHNAIEWFTDGKTDKYVNALIKLRDRDKNGAFSEEEKRKDVFVMDTNRQGVVKLTVNREDNLRLYDAIAEKLHMKQYAGLSAASAFIKNLEKSRRKFTELSTFEQAEVLLQIIRFMRCNAELSDLHLVDCGANCGSILINKDITNIKFTIVDQSICGLTVRERVI